jgi:hypothetical protein
MLATYSLCGVVALVDSMLQIMGPATVGARVIPKIVHVRGTRISADRTDKPGRQTVAQATLATTVDAVLVFL